MRDAPNSNAELNRATSYDVSFKIATSLTHIGGCPLSVRHGETFAASYDEVSRISSILLNLHGLEVQR